MANEKSKETSLDTARKKINEIDAKMAKLFVERMKAAETVADYKMARGLAIFDAAREDEVVARNSLLVEDEVIREYYVNFLRNNMAVSRAYQGRIMSGMRIAYCGTEGAFAHIAASKLYPTAEKVAFGDFKSAYQAVEKGECDLAVLPVENSYNGEVGQVTDLMFSGTLYVNRILELAVTHDLLAVKGADPMGIKKVISHPQALAQCAKYIKKHGYTEQEFSNTALAAKYVAELCDPTVAAIASAEAAELFGLEVVDHDINTSRGNTTRFAVFSRVANKRVANETGVHSILLFTVRNEAGALAKAIDVIGNHGFNMRTLRSRPMKELLWEYYFYVEAEGNVQTEDGLTMMEDLGEFCDKLKFAGTYIKN
ncbi:MAG: chorismate mutase [Clostridia bacterium]|nr:chorismate mutase [Clostridia bacterium]